MKLQLSTAGMSQELKDDLISFLKIHFGEEPIVYPNSLMIREDNGHLEQIDIFKMGVSFSQHHFTDGWKLGAPCHLHFDNQRAELMNKAIEDYSKHAGITVRSIQVNKGTHQSEFVIYPTHAVTIFSIGTLYGQLIEGAKAKDGKPATAPEEMLLDKTNSQLFRQAISDVSQEENVIIDTIECIEGEPLNKFLIHPTPMANLMNIFCRYGQLLEMEKYEKE